MKFRHFVQLICVIIIIVICVREFNKRYVIFPYHKFIPSSQSTVIMKKYSSNQMYSIPLRDIKDATAYIIDQYGEKAILTPEEYRTLFDLFSINLCERVVPPEIYVEQYDEIIKNEILTEDLIKVDLRPQTFYFTNKKGEENYGE